MQDRAAVRFQRIARRKQQRLDILVLYPTPPNRNFDRTDFARQSSARTSDPDVFHGHASKFFCAVQRIAHRVGGCRHIDHEAARYALAGAMTATDNLNFAVFHQCSDHRRHAK